MGYEIIIPEHYEVMGPGAPHSWPGRPGRRWVPWVFSPTGDPVESFECLDCPNCCEVVTVVIDGEIVPGWGGRCGKWEKGVSRATG